MIYCSTTDVKNYLEISDTGQYDATLTVIVNAVNTMIDNDIGTTLDKYDHIAVFRCQSSRQQIFLPTPFIENIIALYINEQSISESDYYLNKRNGIITLKYNEFIDLVEVRYSAGLGAVPHDLRQLAIMQSAYLFEKRKNVTVSSYSIDGTAVNAEPIKRIPLYWDVISNYRFVSFASDLIAHETYEYNTLPVGGTGATLV